MRLWLGCVDRRTSRLLEEIIMSPKPENSSKSKPKSVKLTDAELEKASGGGSSRVARNSTAARRARTPKR